jgi:hypothetical protein
VKPTSKTRVCASVECASSGPCFPTYRNTRADGCARVRVTDTRASVCVSGHGQTQRYAFEVFGKKEAEKDEDEVERGSVEESIYL